MPPFLPTYFAIFEDDSTRKQPPNVQYTQKRFKIIWSQYKQTETGPDGHPIESYQICLPTTTLYESSRNYELQVIDTHHCESAKVPVEVVLKQGMFQADVKTFVWDTGMHLYYAVQHKEIPVMAFLGPERIEGQYYYSKGDDTEEACDLRQGMQCVQRDIAKSVARARISQYHSSTGGYEFQTALAVSTQSSTIEGDIERLRRGQPVINRVPQHVSPPPTPTAPPTILPLPPTPPPPPKFVSELVLRDAAAKGDTCSISLTPFGDCNSVSVTSCFHIFDTESLKVWMKTKGECPVCKQAIGATGILELAPPARTKIETVDTPTQLPPNPFDLF